MPRYFFHLYDDLETLDEEGWELPDLQAAVTHALAEARAVAGAAVVSIGEVTLANRIDISDSNGTVLASVTFKDAVRING